SLRPLWNPPTRCAKSPGDWVLRNPTTGCCASATSGAASRTPNPAMKARRSIPRPSDWRDARPDGGASARCETTDLYWLPALDGGPAYWGSMGRDWRLFRAMRYRSRHVVGGRATLERLKRKEVSHAIAQDAQLGSRRCQPAAIRGAMAQHGPAADPDRRLDGAHRKILLAGRLWT